LSLDKIKREWGDFLNSNSKLIEILKSISKVVQENKQFLTDIDAVIGDGDHGFYGWISSIT